MANHNFEIENFDFMVYITWPDYKSILTLCGILVSKTGALVPGYNPVLRKAKGLAEIPHIQR